MDHECNRDSACVCQAKFGPTILVWLDDAEHTQYSAPYWALRAMAAAETISGRSFRVMRPGQ